MPKETTAPSNRPIGIPIQEILIDCLFDNSFYLPLGRSNRFKTAIELHIFYDRDIKNIINQQIAAKGYKNC